MPEPFQEAERGGFVLVILVMSAVNHAAFFFFLPASWAVVVLSQNAVWQG